MAKYVRILETGHIGILRRYNKRTIIDFIRGYKTTATVMGIPNEHSITLKYKKDIEEISEKEYFKEKLRGK